MGNINQKQSLVLLMQAETTECACPLQDHAIVSVLVLLDYDLGRLEFYRRTFRAWVT